MSEYPTGTGNARKCKNKLNHRHRFTPHTIHLRQIKETYPTRQHNCQKCPRQNKISASLTSGYEIENNLQHNLHYKQTNQKDTRT